MTSPIYVEHGSSPGTPDLETVEEITSRVRRLEEEVAELRGTITRFADVMIGQVKELQEKQEKIVPLPAAVAAAMPITAAPGLVTTDEVVPGSSALVVPQKRPWLLMDLMRDVGTALRMYLDPRYRVRRATQVLLPILLGCFVLNVYFFNWIFTLTIISTVLEKIIDVVLGVLLYKILQREILRYREVVAQLNAWQQAHHAAQNAVIVVDPDSAPHSRLETE